VNGALNNIVGGWGIDGVTTFQRGFPLIFRNGQANDATLFGTGLASQSLPGCHKSFAAGGRPAHGWFNTGCFVAPADSPSAMSRESIRLCAPMGSTTSMSAFKNLLLDGRRASVEFRVESSTCSTGPKFASPNTPLFDEQCQLRIVTSTRAGDKSSVSFSLHEVLVLILAEAPC